MEYLEPLQHLKFVRNMDQKYLKIYSTMSVVVNAGIKIIKQNREIDFNLKENHFTIYYESISDPKIFSNYMFMDFNFIDVAETANYLVTILIEGTPGGKVTTYLSENAEIKIE